MFNLFLGFLIALCFALVFSVGDILPEDGDHVLFDLVHSNKSLTRTVE